jgi:hypothetical protein
LLRRGVRSADYGEPARLVTDFWLREVTTGIGEPDRLLAEVPVISVVGDADPCAVVDESEPRLTESSLAEIQAPNGMGAVTPLLDVAGKAILQSCRQGIAMPLQHCLRNTHFWQQSRSSNAWRRQTTVRWA